MNQTFKNREREKMEENKELNQTVENQQTEEQKNNNMIADYRKKIEERYNNKFSKLQAEYEEQIKVANEELNFYKNDLPKLQTAYINAGGNINYFNDWITVNKTKLDFKDLDNSIKKTFEVSAWAIQNKNNDFSVSQQLNQGSKTDRRFDFSEFEPGTVYKKMR